MSAKIEYKPKEIRVFLDGEIDHHSASLIRVSIDEAILHKKPSMLVLDFGAVSFMDSSGIALILKIHRRMQQSGGRAWIENAEKQPLRVIDASGIDRIVNVSLTKEA